LEEKEVFGHLDGTVMKPAQTVADDVKSEWLKNETKAHHLLVQKLHDSTLTKLLHHDSVAEMWTLLVTEFTVKSSHVVVAMRNSFDNLKCADNGNVWTHLDKLRFKYEELVGIGIESLFDVSWDHIPSYLSAATSVSDDWVDLPFLQMVSNTVSESNSLPSENASELDGNDNSDDGSDWFSEVGDDGLSDDFSADVLLQICFLSSARKFSIFLYLTYFGSII
jgi:hypothetical protein